MISLQTKMASLITIALVMLTFIAGGYVITNSRVAVLKDAELLMKSASIEQVLRLNSQLENIQRTTQTIHKMIENGLFMQDYLKTPDAVRAFLDGLEKTALDVASHVDGIQGMYVRFAPDVGSGNDGFFYVNRHDKLVLEPLTDISKYKQDDVEHVGWFWGASKSTNPIWLAPYDNKNVGMTMFSYVIPVFYKNKFVGVVGVDISLEQFANVANINSVYRNADGHLISVDASCLDGKDACKQNAHNSLVTQHAEHHIPDFIYERVSSELSSGDELVTITIDGKEHKLVFRTLLNGMKYIVHAPSQDIYKKANELIFLMILYILGILIIFNIITIYASKKLIAPLQKLNKDAKQIANGNWDADIKCNTNDEIGELAKSLAVMSEKLKVQITAVKDLAYKDALTNVKNKTAYNEFVEKMKIEKWRDYAIVMFDINYLKKLNDTYGHEEGDALIKCACEHICKVFAHSPVFRMGADEFVAILHGKDYENRFSLIEQFKEEMPKEHIEIKPYTELSVACGMAEWNEADGYDNVFHIADRKMYTDKMAMKQKMVEFS